MALSHIKEALLTKESIQRTLNDKHDGWGASAIRPNYIRGGDEYHDPGKRGLTRVTGDTSFFD